MQKGPLLFENTAIAFADKDLKELKREHLLFSLVKNRNLVKMGSALAEFALKIGLPMGPLFKHTVFDHFVAGESLEKSRVVIQKLADSQVGSLLHFGVEGEDSEKDFDKALKENLNALRFSASDPFVKALCMKITGIGRFGLFEKIQAGKSLTSKEKIEFENVIIRLDQLCEEARASDTALYIDAEEYWIQEVLDDLVLNAMKKYNKEKAVVWDTIQHYRWDQLDYLNKLISEARKEHFFLGVKLVRGAYMEKERNRAERYDYPSPIQESKAKTDEDFNKGMAICLENIDCVSFCIATHNEESCVKLTELIADYGINRDHPHIQFAQLYGMGDHITFNLAEKGYNTNKYLPYGPVKKVIPYLIRRASENSSVEGQMSRELSLLKKELTRRKNNSSMPS